MGGVLGSFFSGLRWALSQVLMEAPTGADSEGSLARPLGVMLHTAPVCVLGGIVLSRMLEPGAISALIESPSPATLVGGLSLIAALVTLMVLSEFYLVKMTSSLTLAVLAVFKELCTLLFATLLGDHLAPADVVGVALCTAGALWYQSSKQHKATQCPCSEEAQSEGMQSENEMQSENGLHVPGVPRAPFKAERSSSPLASPSLVLLGAGAPRSQ